MAIQTLFKVISISSNTNSFGLHGVVIVDKSGLAFEVAVSQINLPKKGNYVTGTVTENGNLHSLPFTYEIPRKLPKPNEEELAAMFPAPTPQNLSLKAIYYCATNRNAWGKGLSIADAKKAAGLKKTDEKKCQFYVMAAMFNNPSADELSNLLSCITADPFSGSPQYYRDDRTDEDTLMINTYHVGWVTIEKNF